MNRLRVRVELNRRKSGVPMEELVSVVEETRKFFHLLAEDVQIPADRGEWLASHFDPESLNFTAEYNGPASSEQILAFGSAFGGATSLRQETIAQFTHIADFIGEDELVGFGLYQSDEESEPSDWRCLSRRDAQRFAGEIQLLAKAAGVAAFDSPLPAVNGAVGGRRLFKDRREREQLAADPSKWIREVESSLASRIGLLESKLEAQAHQVQGLGNSQDVAEERFIKLLGAMESAWSQGPRQLAAPAAERVVEAAGRVGEGAEPGGRWKFGVGLAAAALILATVGAAQLGPWSRAPELPAVPPIAAPVVVAAVQPVVSPAKPEVVEEAPVKVEKVKRTTTESSAMLHQISLEIPSDLKSSIKEQAFVNVSVEIDPKGKVTTAEVESTKGEEADLLTGEALRVARRFRFRPGQQGSKSVASQMVLTFVFDPEPLLGN